MRIRRAGSGVVVVALAILAGWASVAFACSPMPEVYSVLPESSPPGTTVRVEGRDVASGSPVEIRWNGIKGPLLATATPVGGAFSTSVVVPDVAPGVYALVLVSPDAGVGRSAFEVTPPAATTAPATGAAAPASPWTARSTASVSAPADSDGPHALGMALLAVGLAGLFAGTTVAAVRQRRVLAGSR